MGIPVGKLSLYTRVPVSNRPNVYLSPSIPARRTTNYLYDPLYLGLHQRRLRGKEYDALIEEFIASVQSTYPRAVIQFEDFANSKRVSTAARISSSCPRLQR